jgi:hypothetical protein
VSLRRRGDRIGRGRGLDPGRPGQNAANDVSVQSLSNPERVENRTENPFRVNCGAPRVRLDSYTDGLNRIGLLDAGLLFVSYQNDPAHFETQHAELGASDALNEYISHIGSAVFFVPPAPAQGSYVAQQMFG